MNPLIRIGLHSELVLFVQRAFQTVSPGRPYLHNWHIEAIVACLLDVQCGRTKRLLVTQPPRSLKSITISVAYVAWLLGHDPSRVVVVASYSNDLAADLHRQFRLVVESDWYRALFPGTQWDKETGNDFVTTKGGGRFATSVGGTITGRGADLIIVDDPLNANEALSEPARRRVIEWFFGSLVSRLNDKTTGAIIVVMQRLHEDDLAGHLIEKRGWKQLCLPAIATERERVYLGRGVFKIREPGEALHPERESLATLARIKAEIGSLLFSAQYGQQPVPAEGNLIKREWFRIYDAPPLKGPGMRVVQSWDVALGTGSNNDYSVCTTWLMVGNSFYLVDVYRGRIAYPDLRRRIIGLASQHGADAILIEDAGSGMTVLQELRRNMPEGMTMPIGITPRGGKQDRLVAQSARIEAGQVHLPRQAHWLSDFLNEVLAFPNARHDDQVDSLSQFLFWVGRSSLEEGVMVGPVSVPNSYGSPFSDHFSLEQLYMDDYVDYES